MVGRTIVIQAIRKNDYMKTMNKIFQTLLMSTLFLLASCDLQVEENFSWKPGETLMIGGSGSVKMSAANNAAYYVEGHDLSKTYTWTVNGNAVTPVRDGEVLLYNFTGPGTYTIKVSNGTYEGTKTVTVTQ